MTIGLVSLVQKTKVLININSGIAATVVALVAASSALQKGNRTQFNKYLRLRVAAQGLTVVAALGEFNSSSRVMKLTWNLLGGSVYYGTERKNARALDREQKGLPPK